MNYVNMQEKKKYANFIISQIYVKSIIVTIKHVAKGIKRIADMKIPAKGSYPEKKSAPIWTLSKLP